MKYITLLMCLLAVTVGLQAYSMYEGYAGLGETVPSMDPQAAALGGIFAGGDVLNAGQNPAYLGLLKGNAGFQVGAGITRMEDNRSLPMYNFFDSYVDDATYASNTNFYTQLYGGLWYKRALGDGSFTAAALYHPYRDYEYDYKEEVRTNTGSDYDVFPNAIAWNHITGEGQIDALELALAYTMPLHNYNLQNLHIGASLVSLTGEYKTNYRVDWTDWANTQMYPDSLPTINNSSKVDYNGLACRFGLGLEFAERMGLWAAYTPQSELNADGRAGTPDPDNLKNPGTTELALSYKPRNVLRTQVVLGYRYQDWECINGNLHNVATYSAGVEHIIARHFPLRVGFRWETSPLDDELSRAVYCFGSSLPVYDNCDLNLSGEFSNRTWNQEDLFPDSMYNYQALWSSFTPTDRPDMDKVEELYLKTSISLSYHW